MQEKYLKEFREDCLEESLKYCVENSPGKVLEKTPMEIIGGIARRISGITPAYISGHIAGRICKKKYSKNFLEIPRKKMGSLRNPFEETPSNSLRNFRISFRRNF